MLLGNTALRLTLGFQKRETSDMHSLSAGTQSPTLSTMSVADGEMIEGPER
jgi:hypothetical protein